MLSMTACSGNKTQDLPVESVKETETEKQAESLEEKTGNPDEEKLADPEAGTNAEGWKEAYSYSLAQQAFFYCYPLIKQNNAIYGKNDFGSYNRREKMLGPEVKMGASMNVDTLYSIAYVDLTEEPAVFTIPDNPDGRYYSIEFFESYSDCVGYMGTRTTQNKKAAYLVTAPGWEGTVPEGIDQVLECPTNVVTAGARTFSTNTPEDLEIANGLQQEYRIYPLSQWEKDLPQEMKVTPGNEIAMEPVDLTDTAGTIEIINHWIEISGYPKRDEALMQQYGQVGIGPYARKSFGDLEPEVQKAIGNAFEDGMDIIKMAAVEVGSIYDLNKNVNGWSYNPSNWGRMAEIGDFIGRASTQSYSGSAENLIEECVKLRVFVDENGEPLNGSNQYVIHFDKNQIPKTYGFWSLTVYDGEYNLFENEQNRYAVRDIDSDLKLGEDGSLTIYIQKTKPEDPAGNWIPVKEGEEFNIFFRNYLPTQEFMDQTYIAPPIEKKS